MYDVRNTKRQGGGTRPTSPPTKVAGSSRDFQRSGLATGSPATFLVMVASSLRIRSALAAALASAIVACAPARPAPATPSASASSASRGSATPAQADLALVSPADAEPVAAEDIPPSLPASPAREPAGETASAPRDRPKPRNAKEACWQRCRDEHAPDAYCGTRLLSCLRKCGGSIPMEYLLGGGT